MSAAHTPGPWKVVMQYGVWHVREDPLNWDGRGYQHVASLPTEKKGSHYGEMFSANARLIAAAPELLEALQFIREHGEEFSGLAAKKAIAAINKATGATP